MLSAHYRVQLNFSDDLLESAKASVERLYNTVANLENLTDEVKKEKMDKSEEDYLKSLDTYRKKYIDKMDDDFNTANAISVLFELSKLGNHYLLEKVTSADVIEAFLNEFRELFGVLGMPIEVEETLDERIEKLIEERNRARKERNFARSDEIRDQLKEMNIILEDTPQGTRWKRG